MYSGCEANDCLPSEHNHFLAKTNEGRMPFRQSFRLKLISFLDVDTRV